MSCKRSKHVKLIFNHLELFQQISNDKTKLFKWSFGLKNKEIKKSTLETSYFLENTTWMGKNVFECILNPLNHLGKFYITISNCPNDFYTQIFSKTRFDFVIFKNPWKLAYKYIKIIIHYKLIKFLCLKKFKIVTPWPGRDDTWQPSRAFEWVSVSRETIQRLATHTVS